MALVTSRAVVLQTYRYSDTSKILRLMTREHGPRSAIAKGALRPGSRFGGLLEPFAEGDATLYVKEGRELHTLSGFELVRERQALGVDLVRFSGASVLCELVMRLAPEHRDDRLYRVLVDGLDALVKARGGAVPVAVLARIWAIVSVLGFAPDLLRCLECGREIPEGEGARFDHEAGGLRCGRCSPHGRRLSGLGLRRLRRLALGGVPETGGGSGARPEETEGSPGRAREQARLVADFIRYHMAEGTTLRSLDFLIDL